MSRGNHKNLSPFSARANRNKTTSRIATHTKHGVLLLLLLSGLIGITSTITEEIQPSKATAIRNTHTSDKTIAKLPQQASQTLETLPDASPPSNAREAEVTTPRVFTSEESCDNTAKAEKMAEYQQQVSEEDSRHAKIINQLNSTGLVTRYLNANMYSMRVENEAHLHDETRSELAADLDDALAELHCNR